MTRLRHVPPVHSPIPAGALGAGLRALVSEPGGLRERTAARIARRFGARRVLLTDSGTSALVLALTGAARALEGGDAVALPAYGCYDLVTAVRGAGVRAVLYDLEPDTLSPDPASLERALGRGAGTVLVAHLYGVPVDLDVVSEVARDAGALVLEDAAQGVGASYRGRPLGAHGAVSVLSFGRGKGLTGGGGGALIARDGVGASVLEAADRPGTAPGRGGSRLAAAAAQWALGRPSLYGLPASLPFLELGETVYRPPRAPRSAPPVCLAVLERTWDASLAEADVRRRRARRLARRAREADDLVVPSPPPAARPGWLRLPVVARDRAARARLSGRRARRLGVVPGYPRPLHRLEAFRETRSPTERSDPDVVPPLPGSEALSERLFTLPVHGRMSLGDIERVEELVSPRG